MNDHVQQSFGAELRQAREQSGLTLRDIANTTKLPLTALKALEEDRVSKLPGGIYRRSIVRAYASEVGLDPQAAVRVFVEQHPDDVPSSTAVSVTASRGLPRVLQAAISLIGALIPIVAGVIYFASGTPGSASPRDIVAVLPARASDQDEPQIVPAALSDMNALAMLISVSSRTRLAVIADGREVIARQVEPGEVVRLSVADDVVLMGDNAGAVQFSINGRAGRTLGDAGTPLSARIPRDDYLSWLIQQ